MTHAQTLARALNALTKSPQFSYAKARAAARQDGNVDWPRTKARNEGFNPDVDGCESFVMRDGTLCEWNSGAYTYVARAAG
ncbi:MAG: hypothetical protein ABR591_06145 [Candidatus Velthaea sp.]